MEDASDYRGWPKAELHLHLEGSVEPETMRELDPSLSADNVRARYRFQGFQGFIDTYKWVVERLRTPGDYACITRALLRRLAAENVRYAEITLSAGVVLWKGQEFAPVYAAVHQAAAGSSIEVHWILDAVRHFGAEHARQVAELAAERVHDGVVAFGIGGDEERGPAVWFREVYGFARGAGLRLTAHAGEGAGPESVWAALEIGAERIGHGIRAVEDAALVAHLRDRGIPLEVCITSNVMTGVVGSPAAHPVRRLYDAGVPITLNTDDPAIFGVTLSGEYALAARQFGFSEAELRGIAENASRYAFRGSAGRSPAAAPWHPVPRP
ncbi:MAG TPA: adenosine deaminase [Bryobacteraceae bacterium]|nr:adenosine deaminase [Bryobacteraceae bacterium]